MTIYELKDRHPVAFDRLIRWWKGVYHLWPSRKLTPDLDGMVAFFGPESQRDERGCLIPYIRDGEE